MIFWDKFLIQNQNENINTEDDLKQNDRVKQIFLLNSANVALLLGSISVNDAKMEKWNKADQYKVYWSRDIGYIYLGVLKI